MKQKKQRIPLAIAAFAMTIGSAQAATILLSENWETPGMVGGASADISGATNAPLTGWAGFGLNNDNTTMLLTPSGGNVLRDQGGFGGTYGSGTNAGNAVRVRSSNGAMLNEVAFALTIFPAVTFSFDLKQVTANYVQVVEFSNNIGFLTTGTTGGENNAVLLLDTFNGNTPADLNVWLAKSYTLTDGVDVGFTDESYFRIRKLRPNPAGTTAGANGNFHVYDNLVISGVPEPTAALLGSLGALALLRRRR